MKIGIIGYGFVGKAHDMGFEKNMRFVWFKRVFDLHPAQNEFSSFL